MKDCILAFGALASLIAGAARPSSGQAQPVSPPKMESTAARSDSAACKSLAGTYTLVTIDGHAIPFAPTHPDAPANAPAPPEVVASSLVMRGDGSFILAMGYRRTVDGTQRIFVSPFSGTCTSDGKGIVARWDGAGTTRLMSILDTLVIDNEGIRFAYQKRR